MVNRLQYDNITWIDVLGPTEQDVAILAKEFGIDPVVAHDLLTPTPKSKVEVSENYFYTVLHFPVSKHTHLEDSTVQEVDFIVGKNFVITVRYEMIDALERLAKEVEVKAIVNKDMDRKNGNFLFFIMLKELYESIENELAYVNDWMLVIEKGIFMGKEREMTISLSHALRVLLDFKKAMRQHGHILPAISLSGKKIFGEDFGFQIEALETEHAYILETINNHNESAVELRETNNSLLSTKQNEVMKTLTIMSFIMLPLSLIAGIFSMNTTLPIVGTKGDFLIVIGIMLASALAVFSLFKKNKWI